jgi:hypothetical protein
MGAPLIPQNWTRRCIYPGVATALLRLRAGLINLKQIFQSCMDLGRLCDSLFFAAPGGNGWLVGYVIRDRMKYSAITSVSDKIREFPALLVALVPD